jgi:hypothetical protein
VVDDEVRLIILVKAVDLLSQLMVALDLNHYPVIVPVQKIKN